MPGELGAGGVADLGNLLRGRDHALGGFLSVLGAQCHHRLRISRAGLGLGVFDAALEHFLGQLGLQRHDALGILNRKLRHAHGSFHVLAVKFAELLDLACHDVSPVIDLPK